MERPKPYNLDEFIDKLENIYTATINNSESPPLNFAKAFYTLALEIKELKEFYKDHLRCDHNDPPY